MNKGKGLFAAFAFLLSLCGKAEQGTVNISGEIGISIHKIQNQRIKRTVIQNLYNACASVGILGGISAGNDEELLDAVGSGLSNMQNIDFLGGIHGKVF